MLEVPVNAVSPNPKQPRTRFDDEAIGSLAASIREVGILQPIVVRKAGAGYELIAGERRLRAAKLAGLATIPVVVRDTDDADTLREALIENIHREDLGPIELAEAFRQLLEELGLKQEELADRVGVSRSHIANTIRLLQLPIEVQQLLTDGKLQAGHARALLALGDAEAQNTLALRTVAEDLTVRDVEDLVRRYVDGPRRQARQSGGRGRSPADRHHHVRGRGDLVGAAGHQGADPDGEEARPRGDRVRVGRRPGAHRVRDRSDRDLGSRPTDPRSILAPTHALFPPGLVAVGGCPRRRVGDALGRTPSEPSVGRPAARRSRRHPGRLSRRTGARGGVASGTGAGGGSTVLARSARALARADGGVRRPVAPVPRGAWRRCRVPCGVSRGSVPGAGSGGSGSGHRGGSTPASDRSGRT